jgi:glycosyltransferase domain-containing protein
MRELNIPQAKRQPLNDITIIIPTYERQNILLRSIIYWAKLNVKVVIVDGSNESLPFAVVRILSPFVNIKYIHEKLSFNIRMSIASKNLTTKYVAMVGDDEFLTMAGIEAITNELNKSPVDVVGCIGQSIKFGLVDNSDINFGPGYFHDNYSVVDEEVAARLFKAMSNYNAATCYAILKREIWIQSWGSISNWSSPYASEIEQAIATYASGKFITVNKLYWLRSFEFQPVHHNISFNRKLSFSNWWLSNRFASEHNVFVAKLSEHIVASGYDCIADAEKVIRESIAAYVDFERSVSHVDFGYLDKIKKLTGSILRVFISEDSLDKLKSILGYPVDVKLISTFDFGSLEDFILSRDSCSDIYGLNDALIDELRSIVLLVNDFNKTSVIFDA